ncbi:amidase domain-containing protein [Actinomyces ruminis]|nr:amidase domain-containing protein [Actinomyces ruminis]
MSKTTMARLKIVVVRGLGAATLVTTALAVTPQFLTSAVAANSVVDDDAVLAAVEEYQSSLDALWTDPDTATTASLLTSAQSVVMEVRDGMNEDGTPVASAASEVTLLQATVQDDGTVLAEVSISTTFTYEGMGDSEAPGVWSDRHSIQLTVDDAGNYSVAEDVVESTEVVAGTGDVPDDYAPERSSDTRSSSASMGGGSAGSTAVPVAFVPAYNTSPPDVGAMVNYALTWTSSPNDGDDEDDFNSEYPVLNNNCANFASQVLRAGGWEYDQGINPWSTSFWAPNLWGPAGASRTWVNSAYQYTYVVNGSYFYLDNIWNASAGDLLYVDWDPDGVADGTIDHVMVVTSVSLTGVPRVSQKTPNRSNIPLTQSIRNAEAQGKTSIVWYGLQRDEMLPR